MDRLAAMQVFVRVAEAGSFTAVADQMNVARSAVTRQIAALESHLGVKLMARSTRPRSAPAASLARWAVAPRSASSRAALAPTPTSSVSLSSTPSARTSPRITRTSAPAVSHPDRRYLRLLPRPVYPAKSAFARRTGVRSGSSSHHRILHRAGPRDAAHAISPKQVYPRGTPNLRDPPKTPRSAPPPGSCNHRHTASAAPCRISGAITRSPLPCAPWLIARSQHISVPTF